MAGGVAVVGVNPGANSAASVVIDSWNARFITSGGGGVAALGFFFRSDLGDIDGPECAAAAAELRFRCIFPSGFFPADRRRAEFRRQCVVVRLAWLLALTALIPSSKKDRFLCALDGIGVAGSACCWPCRARAAWAKRSDAGGAAGVSSLRASLFRGCLQSSPFPKVNLLFPSFFFNLRWRLMSVAVRSSVDVADRRVTCWCRWSSCIACKEPCVVGI